MHLGDGLYLFLDRDLPIESLIIESDAKIIVDMLNKGECLHWFLLKDWKEVLALIKKSVGIFHVYREVNAVADGLANEGINQGKMTTYQRRNDLPRVSNGYFTLDRGGLPYIRRGRP